jgi:putative transcription factor
MCGKESDNLQQATVEGTKMRVCGNCSDFGVEEVGEEGEVTGRSKVTKSLEERQKRQSSRDVYDEHQEELVPDYGDRVREAREARGWSQDDLAKHLKEKASVIKKVENQSRQPRDELVDLLEKELDVTLMEVPDSPSRGQSSEGSGGGMTLGDHLKDALEDD